MKVATVIYPAPLPDTLIALAAFRPERVRGHWDDTDRADLWLSGIEIRSRRGWVGVWHGGDRPFALDLAAAEYGLREETEACGWSWSMPRFSQPERPHTYAVHMDRSGHTTQATCATPAHALASALLAAFHRNPGHWGTERRNEILGNVSGAQHREGEQPG